MRYKEARTLLPQNAPSASLSLQTAKARIVVGVEEWDWNCRANFGGADEVF